MVRLAQEKGCVGPVIRRMHIVLRGAVQGVGFRPFVYRLANDLALPGWVLNSPEGVFIEVEGEKETLDSFLFRLQQEKPRPSSIQSLEFSLLDPAGFNQFEIRESESLGALTALIMPDIATCEKCLSEILDPHNRRYRYPFTNCTHCGPRFSIIEALPYDRPNTSMKSFRMCSECLREYEDPADRRFHAQPNACPSCGPALELWDRAGRARCSGNDALLQAAEAIRQGKTVAVKGLGGFHLMADARNNEAVASLRLKKRREEKPFAVMYPALEQVEQDCRLQPLEARLLTSAESPIVLLSRGKNQPRISPAVAPGNPYLGVMLPYTPLHHLLMKELGSPVVATSGNLSDEPICTDEREALSRLAEIADFFLVHNRPIVRHVDDSIARVILGRELVMRRARGYAPLPLQSHGSLPEILAVGGHLKNSIALSVGKNIFVSQHIGDLENNEALDAFRNVIRSFCGLYKVDPSHVASDLHPDYASTRFAQESGVPVIAIQHHYAHVAACMAENEVEGRALGVSWDGTGYGPDGTVWGGEFLIPDEKAEAGFIRFATMRKFRLPGSGAAVKEPRRSALGILYEIFGPAVFEETDLCPVASLCGSEPSVLGQMLQKGINSPWTTSAGRLFDAVASLAGIRQAIKFEGQAAMELEFALAAEELEETYPVSIEENRECGDEAWRAALTVDWEPMIRGIIQDVRGGAGPGLISKKFHNTLVAAIVEIARRAGEERVVLTGGCFQNRFLIEHAVLRLEREGFRPYWHQRIPPNDGGIALGQIAAASRILKSLEPKIKESSPCAWQSRGK